MLSDGGLSDGGDSDGATAVLLPPISVIIVRTRVLMFKSSPPLPYPTPPPSHFSSDVGWKVIQETLSNVYAKLAEMPPEMGGSGDGGGVSGGVGRTPLKTSYSEAYGNCFRMCSGRAPYNVSPQVYGRYTEAVSEYLSGTVLASLAELQGAELLRALELCWKKLGILLHFYLKRIFTYLDRFYVGCYGKHSIEVRMVNLYPKKGGGCLEGDGYLSRGLSVGGIVYGGKP